MATYLRLVCPHCRTALIFQTTSDKIRALANAGYDRVEIAKYLDNMEVYVSPFPSVNGKWQVSNAGGQEPKWRSDGKELFYVSREGKIMAVSVSAGGRL